MEMSLSMTIPKSTSRWLLGLIVVSYLALGTLYALRTPKWQAPDEPAHFNYIQYVAQESSFPVLQSGDYPQQYLEEIKAARFPPYMSIAPLRYEFHQPPLYYLLGAILYRLTASLGFERQFLALRLFSVALGAMVLLVAYLLGREIFPEAEFLPLAATAFIAVVPMHLTMTAAINNDTLAELLLLLILWQAVRAAQNGLATRRAIAIGVLLGLALLTKTTVYLPAAGVIVVAVLRPHSRRSGAKERTEVRTTSHFAHKGLDYGCIRDVLYVLTPALLLAIPWFVRNAWVYGNLDFFVWKRHDLVVAGQLRTADLMAQIGPVGLLKQFTLTTFHSFWAQFGWMGVLVDERIYWGLALLCAMLAFGFLICMVRVWRDRTIPTQAQSRAQTLLAVAAVLSILTYVGYNIKFVQHQGRYLFPALGPLALGVALSLQEMLRPRTARLLATALLVASMLLFMCGALSGDLPGWSLALLAAGAAFLASAGWLPAHWRWLPPALLYVAFLALDWICLFAYIVPMLRVGGS